VGKMTFSVGSFVKARGVLIDQDTIVSEYLNIFGNAKK